MGLKTSSGYFSPRSQGGEIERTVIPIESVERNDYNIYRQISRVRDTLQSRCQCDYSFDFTLEHGKIYVMRTRSEDSIRERLTYRASDWDDRENGWPRSLNDILVGKGGAEREADDDGWNRRAA